MEPTLYTRIPYEVSAMNVTPENLDAIARWTGGRVVQTNNTSPAFLMIPNVDEPRGVFEAYSGDYVVKGTDGRFTRIKQDTFLNEFEMKVVEVQ